MMLRMTDRKREVLNLLAEGLSNKEIAERLGLAERTVKQHLQKMYAIFGVNGRVALLRVAVIAPNINAGKQGPPLPALTEKEHKIARLICAGAGNRDIAEHIGNTYEYTRKKVEQIFDKCGVWSRLELAAQFGESL